MECGTNIHHNQEKSNKEKGTNREWRKRMKNGHDDYKMDMLDKNSGSNRLHHPLISRYRYFNFGKRTSIDDL